MLRFYLMPGKVLTMHYKMSIIFKGGIIMKKSTSISIRVSEDELELFKTASRLEAYASYSEFVRRTALIEAAKIVKNNPKAESEDEKNE